MDADRSFLERAMDTARRAVMAASAASLRHWRSALHVDWKADRSPVTAADRESERAILEAIRKEFPSHSVLAEESGALDGDVDHRWIVDPLDGTRGFARGGAFWGPLVALERHGEIVAGAAALPALGETYWAGRGLGAWGNDAHLSVSGTASWDEATLSLGELRALLSGPSAAGVQALVAGAASTRCYGDVAGAVLVLTGRAEAWIEAGVKPWDLAALAVLVEEAGGRFTDFEGRRSLETGCAAATNGRVHDHVLSALRPRAERGR
jgi:histidinol-phosphatase